MDSLERGNSKSRWLFVTGKLAENELRQVLARIAAPAGFAYEVAVLKISVAALMDVDFVRRRLTLEGTFDRVMLPGWCGGEIDHLQETFGAPFVRGPRDLYDLPEFFGQAETETSPPEDYRIEILAEINHAPQLTDAEIVRQAEAYRASGANVIDLGCQPGETWSRAGDVTDLLRQEGFRVSIDSFNRREVEPAVASGAELVLSCRQENLDWAQHLDAELVVIPESCQDWRTLEPVVEKLSAAGRPFRLDPILEPIGFGFADSLWRFYEVRRAWPDLPMMMGVGNLTELSAVDSAGVNFLLTAICAELGVNSVLTTEVANWCRTSVAEIDVARRLIDDSMTNRRLPKHQDQRLLMLRDRRETSRGDDALASLADQLRDPNYRIFAERGEIHVMNRDGHWRGSDPDALFEEIRRSNPSLDAAHAFYLGVELGKAHTAALLGKQYVQDEELAWGFLTRQQRNRHSS